jgi:general secretion pathway protein G
MGQLRRRGFTFIEVAVTVAIVGLLASVAAPLAHVAVQRSKEQELRTSLRQIRTAIDAYKRAADEGRVAKKADETGYPRALEVLVEGVEDLKHVDRRKIYFLRRVPRDPFAETAAGAAPGWGQRSYASPPQSPAEGGDVFDVYSRAPGAGLNGIAYREW